MQFRLMLDRDQLDHARKMAREIAGHLHKYVSRHTSLAVERAALRAFGIHGQVGGRPITEVIVEKIGTERLRDGAGYWLGYAMWEGKREPQAAAHHLAKVGLPDHLPRGLPHGEIRRMAREAAGGYLGRLAQAAALREAGTVRRRGPLVFAEVATGQLARDHEVMRALAKAGADGIVLRPPLAPHVEQLHHKTGGWRAHKYDLFDGITKGAETVAEAARHRQSACQLIWGGNHLLTPEVGVACGMIPIHGIEYDCLTMARHGGVHFKRALVDQHFLYRFCARVGMTVHVASERWHAWVDGYTDGHEFLVGMMLIEALGALAGLPLERIIARHSLMIANGRGDRLALELAHAQLARELFPQVPLGIALPGVVAHPQDAVLASAMAGLADYGHQFLPAPTGEKGSAVSPEERIAAVQRPATWLAEIGDDIGFAPNGKIIRRTHTLLEQALKELQHLHRRDFLKLVGDEAKGLFAIPDTGAGLDGVVQKGKFYWHPVEEWMGQ